MRWGGSLIGPELFGVRVSLRRRPQRRKIGQRDPRPPGSFQRKNNGLPGHSLGRPASGQEADMAADLSFRCFFARNYREAGGWPTPFGLPLTSYSELSVKDSWKMPTRT
jgi:hypothetical protein